MIKRLFFTLLLTIALTATAVAADKNPVAVIETSMGNIKVELFAKEVMPEFQEAHPQLLKWKEQVLNREIELEEIDTSAFKDRYGGTMKAMAPVKAKAQAAE